MPRRNNITEMLGLIIMGIVFSNLYTGVVTAAEPFNKIYTQSTRSVDAGSTTPIVVATVNIYNAKILSQKGNDIDISFDIFNREGIQSGVRYAVVVSSSTGGIGSNSYVYDEVLNLGEGQTVHRDIQYTAPNYLADSSYSLSIESRNSSGLPLAIVKIGDVHLVKSSMPVNFIPETCYMTVRGEAGKKHYALLQGVDISSNENLIVTCSVDNFINSDKLIPIFETRQGSAYGDPVNVVDYKQLIDVKGGRSLISFELPKAIKPQLYEVSVRLSKKAGQVVTNDLRMRYVIRGVSGTIRNIVFDKATYKAGEVASVQVFWSPATDVFNGSRKVGTDIGSTTVNMTMKDSEGVVCGTAQSNLVSAISNVSMPIISDCDRPTIETSLVSESTNSKGIILDTKLFQAPVSQTLSPIVKAVLGSGYIILIILIILALVWALHKYLVNKKAGDTIKSLALFFIVTASVFFGGKDVKADTAYFDTGRMFHRYYVVYNLNKNYGIGEKYSPGETGTLSVQVQNLDGAYDIKDGIDIFSAVDAYPTDVPQDSDYMALYALATSPGHVDVSGGNWTPVITKSFAAPATNGEHRVYFTMIASFLAGNTVHSYGTFGLRFDVGSNTLAYSCWLDKTNAAVGDTVAWRYTVTGGDMSVPPYKAYQGWSQDGGVTVDPSTDTPYNVTYSTAGVKHMYIKVFDSTKINTLGWRECTGTVNVATPVATYSDIGLRINQGTQSTPDIQHIAIEKVKTNSPLRIMKGGVEYGVALVAPNDTNATKLMIKVGGVAKALRVCTLAKDCDFVQ